MSVDSDDEDLFPVGHVPLSPKASYITNQSDNEQDVPPPKYVAPNFMSAREFRNTLLPRRIADKTQPSGYRMALPGELFDENGEPAKLYDFFESKANALDEFGVGVSLYFRTLKAFCIVFLICGCVSLLAVDANRVNQVQKSHSGPAEEPNCDGTYSPDVETPMRMTGSVYGVTREDLKFNRQGVADIVTCVLTTLVALVANYIEKSEVEKIDEAQQTTSDYSVVVENPPTTRSEPRDYYEFFSQFGQVVLVTVAKKNGQLLRAIARKKLLTTRFAALETPVACYSLPPPIISALRYLREVGVLPSVASLTRDIEKVTSRIEGLCNRDYEPWRVFVTFNTEAERENCLSRMAVGKLDIWMNRASKNSHCAFHGKVLRVKKAPEPSDIIYEHSHTSFVIRMLHYLMSYALCYCMIHVSFLIVYYLTINDNNSNVIFVAIVISAINAGLPVVIKIITQRLELHFDEGHVQRSVLVKLMAARCINSALLIYLVVDYDEFFSLESLERMQTVLIADAIATPVFRFLNLWDTFQRYVLAPLFGTTQAQFNARWQGAEWTLAERYTDCLKSVFTGLFFAVPIPTGQFITAFAMISTYMVDKYSLFRLWKRKPQINEGLAQLSRYFFFATVWCHLYISMRYFANWPYRGVCGTDIEDAPVCRISCDITPHMTQDQSKLVKLYGYACIVALSILLAWGLLYRVSKRILKLFSPSMMKSVNDKTHSNGSATFRCIQGAPAYVPVVERKQLLAPIICCDVSRVPTRFSPVRISGSWDEQHDPVEFSVFKSGDYPELEGSAKHSCFSLIEFYAMPEVVATLSHAQDDADHSCTDDEGGFELTRLDTAQVDLAVEESLTRHITPADFEKSEIIDDKTLPDGWEKRRCDDGRVFYVDFNLMDISWTPPPQSSLPEHLRRTFRSMRRLDGKQQSSGQLPVVAENCSTFDEFDNRLPPQWERKLSKDGRHYYVNHRTKQTYWTLPDGIADETV
mmetsp:Transcript_22556/g.32971  ORF Transcript_22556/g.32971 Transcript_22556/m.32971 type:complete len:978 (-) Transcript_22556:237-3170(-)|eukprot:CAMPEP_0185029704 /NCGR_PEP_ID=MMETSP1103-20130426/16156_1 /TAXON_ID=36769 /ORGANISM="Paraphysomonas bandaiensis, Strain Caron Lab Isolate" /LENGTH=977 /DNA_ID=CAMNT_0027564531 /DNA_START=75 /DNA_END=3008 /DNA_ORIENTATION=-